MESQTALVELDNGEQFEVEVQPAPRDGRTVEVGLGQAIPRKLSDSLAKLRVVAATIAEKLRDANPDELEVNFGVKLGGTTNLIVSAGTAEANVTVKLKWTRKDDAEADSGAAHSR